MVYTCQGRLGESEELQLEDLETRKRKLGANHPDTLSSMHNLAYTWKYMGRYEEAIQLMNDTIQRRAQAIGVQHPLYLRSVEVLHEWEAERLEKEDTQQLTQESDEMSTPMVPEPLTSIDHPVEGSTRSVSDRRQRRVELSQLFEGFRRSSQRASASSRG